MGQDGRGGMLTAARAADAAHGALPPALRWRRRDFFELGALPGAVPCARLHSRLVLGEWGLPGDLVHSAELVASELATNAVSASGQAADTAPIRLWLFGGRTRALILVWDSSSAPPSPAAPQSDAESGRGLQLVEAVSTQWSWYTTPDSAGKVVWALLGGPPG